MRVQLTLRCHNLRLRGITPALAGTTAEKMLFLMAFWDHPRACGYNEMLKVMQPITKGSPPRLRVQPLVEFDGKEYTGITPALAGTTWCVPMQFFTVRDHPRACGYNHRGKRIRRPLQGSPPRLRVQPWEIKTQTLNGGITPALAGTTISLLM